MIMWWKELLLPDSYWYTQKWILWSPTGGVKTSLLKGAADGILCHPWQNNGWRKQWGSIWERVCLLQPSSQCVCNLYSFCDALAEAQIVEGWKIPTRKNHTFSCYFRADRVTLRTQRKKGSRVEWWAYIEKAIHYSVERIKRWMDVKLWYLKMLVAKEFILLPNRNHNIEPENVFMTISMTLTQLQVISPFWLFPFLRLNFFCFLIFFF